MTLGEITDRSRRTLAHGTDAALYRVAPRLWRRRWLPDPRSLLSSELTSTPRGILLPERALAVRDRFPRECEALLRRADAVVEHRFRFFGYPETVIDDPAADVDPFTGRSWPTKHGKRVKFRQGGAGDPKWIWELNRCQDLPLLVAAWLLSGEARYAAFAAERLEKWIETHPPGRGIAWSNGFEAGMRAISVAVAFDGLRGSDQLSRERAELVARSLWQTVTWIERDPSIGSSANNHRIGELVGVVAVATMVPELKGSERRLERALAELAEEVERQIRPDGTNAEQAFAYQVFVLDLLLVALALVDLRDPCAPEPLNAALTRSAEALWAQLGDDEPEPRYGDADDGRALVLDAADSRSARGVAGSIASRSGHTGAARVAGALDPMGLWLFGLEGAERFEAAARAGHPAPGSLTLNDAGLTVLRAGSCRTLFDHGPHGYLSIAAHGHADALAIDVSLGNQPLVSDPGVGSYSVRPEVRRAFRGTGLHATVTVDAADSSEPGGPFLWTRHARSRLLSLDPEGTAIGEHDGYSRLSDPVVHRRAVVPIGGTLLIHDRLEAIGSHRYSQRWPFHPALEIAECGRRDVLLRGERAGVLLLFAALREFELQMTKGQESPPLGWWSPGLESVVPAWLAAVDLDAEGAVELTAFIVPFLGEAPNVADYGLRLERRDEATVVALEPGAHEIEIDLAAPRPTVKRSNVVGAA
jgi:uncharacterized heparinase superfamily protein